MSKIKLKLAVLMALSLCHLTACSKGLDKQREEKPKEETKMKISVTSNGKIFYPPKKLDTSKTPLANAKNGTLAYYAPWGNVVMFYGDFGSASGLYELGFAVSGGENIKEMSGTIQVEQYEIRK